MNLPSVSAVVLTKNEEKNIKLCVESLNFCDEIVVVDDNSTDGTVEIIQRLKIKYQNDNLKFKIFQRALDGDFAGQRNFGLSKARGNWTLFVDADEIVSAELAKEITDHWSGFYNSFKKTPALAVGIYIKRQDYMWGRELKHGEVGDVKVLRLAKKNAGKWMRRVHEYWDVPGPTATLNSPLLHYPHQALGEFIFEINKYSTLHAQQKFEEGENANLLKIYFWPKFKFIKDWLLLGGFMDGTHGFIHAVMMSFHSFLAWSKLWLLRN